MTTNEPPNDPSADGIDTVLGDSRERPTFSRVLIVLAATVVVLVGMRLAAPVLNPIIFAVVLSVLFAPIHAWLGRQGLPRPVALVTMLLGLTLLFAAIFYVLGASIARFSSGVGTYSAELNDRLAPLQALARDLGFARVDLRNVVQPHYLAGTVGAVLSGVAGFLSNLILMILLFLLAEGPAMMGRMRESVGGDHPQVERLDTFPETRWLARFMGMGSPDARAGPSR